MITLELENEQYDLPEGWHEVSVGKFQKILEIINLFGDYKSEIEYVIDMLQVLTDAPKSSLMKMTRGSFDILANKLQWLNVDVQPVEKSSWIIGGVEYMPLKNLDGLSMGDSVSLELMIKESTEANILGNILPILIRKVKKIESNGGAIKKVPDEFDAEEYAQTREQFLHKIMVAEVISLKVFFSDGGKEFSSILKDTLEKEKELQMMTKDDLSAQ